MVVATALLACQVGLALVFALSAITKLADPHQYRAFKGSLPRTIGVPQRFAGLLAASVVVAEAAVPVLLIAGLAGAGLRLIAFAYTAALCAALTIAIGHMLRAQVQEPCHCFGTGNRPPGRADLWRNLALLGAAVAAGVLSYGSGSEAVLMGYPQIVMIFLMALGVFNAVVVVIILRKFGEQSERLRMNMEGVTNPEPIMMTADQQVGRFEVTTADGATLTAGDLRGTTLVGFLSPTCPACAESRPGFVLRAMESGREQTIAVLVGDDETTRALHDRLAGVARVVIEPLNGSLARAFKVDGFPAFALLSGDVVVASHFALERLPQAAPA
jgi:uncharacterized membrane protein YphA (DoxX/SURF4 family)